MSKKSNSCTKSRNRQRVPDIVVSNPQNTEEELDGDAVADEDPG